MELQSDSEQDKSSSHMITISVFPKQQGREKMQQAWSPRKSALQDPC